MSLTNSKAAADVQRLLREVRVRIEATAKEVRDVTDAVMALRLRRAELFKDLAKLRLETLAGERIGENLDLAERQAAQILRERDQVLTALEREVAEATAREESLAEERVATVERIEALKTEIEELEAGVEARLAYDPAYQTQARQAQEAEVKASRAERKAEQAAKDRIEKGKPYEADPFFMYLWQRKYGTKDYRDWPAFRYFDGKVARLCNFDLARAGYAALLGLPERLSEHAERLRAEVEGQADLLEAVKWEALAAAGHQALTDKLASEISHAKQLGEKLAASVEALRGVRQRQATFLGGADKAIKQAVKLLATDLEKDDLKTLFDEARATPMPEDDEIVAELEQIMAELEDRETELAEGRSVLRAQSQHLSELEEVAGTLRDQIPAEEGSSMAGFLAVGGLTVAGLASVGVPWWAVAVGVGVAAVAAAGSDNESDES
jgi:hypothetical protein